MHNATQPHVTHLRIAVFALLHDPAGWISIGRPIILHTTATLAALCSSLCVRQAFILRLIVSSMSFPSLSYTLPRRAHDLDKGSSIYNSSGSQASLTRRTSRRMERAWRFMSCSMVHSPSRLSPSPRREAGSGLQQSNEESKEEMDGHLKDNGTIWWCGPCPRVV